MYLLPCLVTETTYALECRAVALAAASIPKCAVATRHPTLLHTGSRGEVRSNYTAASTNRPTTTLEQPQHSTAAAAGCPLLQARKRLENTTCLLASSCQQNMHDWAWPTDTLLQTAGALHHHNSSKPHSSASQNGRHTMNTAPSCCRSKPSHPRSAKSFTHKQHSRRQHSQHEKTAHTPECVHIRLQLILLAHPAFTPRGCSLLFNTAQLKGRSPKTQPSQKNIHKACIKQDPTWVPQQQQGRAARVMCKQEHETRPCPNPLPVSLHNYHVGRTAPEHCHKALTRAAPACAK